MNDYVTRKEFEAFRLEFKDEGIDERYMKSGDFRTYLLDIRNVIFEALRIQDEKMSRHFDNQIQEHRLISQRIENDSRQTADRPERNKMENDEEHLGFSRRLKTLEA